MLGREEVIELLEMIIICVKKADYYNIKEIAELKLEHLKEEERISNIKKMKWGKFNKYNNKDYEKLN